MPRDLIEQHCVLLMNEDQTLSIEVWFFGYSAESVEKFISEKYADSKRWVKFKIMS